MTLDEITERLAMCPNRFLDFGPLLDFPVLCQAYTVEKLSVWQLQTEDIFDIIALQSKGMPRGRAEGTLYELTDKQLLSLDKEKQVEECYFRMSLPVYIPFNDKDGNFMTVHAHAYIGRKDFWVERIEHDQSDWREREIGTDVVVRSMVYRPGRTKREFSLLSRYPDPNPLLNYRYRFLPPDTGYNNHSLSVPKAVAKRVAERNNQLAEVMRKMNKKEGFNYFFDGEL